MICLNQGIACDGEEDCKAPLLCPYFEPEETPEMFYEDEWGAWEKNQLANEEI
jgi:hypothetical protein